MAVDHSASPPPAPLALTITRTFDAPRALVFNAWTEPDRVMRWWGPHGFVTHSCTVDLRVGGAWRLCMRRPDGVEHWLGGVYREIVAPERLVFTWQWEPGPAPFTDWVPGGVPLHETIVTVTLVDRHGRTELTLHQELFESAESRDSHDWGWGEALERLAEGALE